MKRSTDPQSSLSRAWVKPVALVAAGVVVAVVAAIVLQSRSATQAPDRDAASAIRESLGLARPEQVFLAYPEAGPLEPFPPNCDLACAGRSLPPGKAFVQVSQGRHGYGAGDSPPANCRLLSVRFPPEDSEQLTAEPMPVFVGSAANSSQLGACNPGVQLRSVSGSRTQLPTWYRTEYGVAVSIPERMAGGLVPLGVCARDKNGAVRQYKVDPDDEWLAFDDPTYCRGLL